MHGRFESDISDISLALSDDANVSSVSDYLNQLTEPEFCDVPTKNAESTSNITANGMSKPCLMESDTSSDESWKGVVKRNGCSKARRLSVSSDSSKSSIREITPVPCLPVAPLSPGNLNRGMGRQPKKPTVKDLYQRYLKTNVVMNSKHYDDLLSKSRYLRSLEDRMPPGSIEAVKKNIFNQNMFCEPNPLMTRINRNVFPEPPELEYSIVEKAAMTWLSQIADDNNMTTDEVITSMFNVMNLTDSKISTIVLIGESNSGKTVLSKLLKSVYEHYECGIIQSAIGRNVSDFWLQDCTGKSIYVCEELFINTKEICQRFKAIMEGNETLDTNVKYGSNKALPRRPFIVTMNGTTKYDLAGEFSEEYKALANICVVLLMGTSLKNILPDFVIDCVVKYKTYFLKVLRARFIAISVTEAKKTRNKLADWLAGR